MGSLPSLLEAKAAVQAARGRGPDAVLLALWCLGEAFRAWGFSSCSVRVDPGTATDLGLPAGCEATLGVPGCPVHVEVTDG